MEATKKQKVTQKQCENERDGSRNEEHEKWNHKQKEKILKGNIIKDGRKKMEEKLEGLSIIGKRKRAFH